MEKQYYKIAEKTNLPPQGIHLVHFVLMNMKSACVFAPSSDYPGESYYTPVNICSAIVAYMKWQHSKDPWGTLEKFGFVSAAQIGVAIKAIQKNRKMKIGSKLDLDFDAFEGLFERDSVSQLRPVRWIQEFDSKTKAVEANKLLSSHFASNSFDTLVVNRRRFPEHVRADLQLALDHIYKGKDEIQLHGLNPRHSHEGLNFRSLTETSEHYKVSIGPLSYSEISVGAEETVQCLTNGLWLAMESDTPIAVVLGKAPAYGSKGIQVEFVTPDSDQAQDLSNKFFGELQKLVENSRCYRGKILSFEISEDYRGQETGVKVHELKQVARDEVILPSKTLELLDRNIIDFVKQRPELKKRGMNLKKGLLFFGPPGTGKTHTVHYLSRALPGTTTLIITSEQIGMLSRYMTLARLLQPSLVIIEDADLIARQREDMNTCEEVLLNKLLNEMDGLRADAEVTFVLTTNRPEALEEALTARPGRIDQAIEFPLPDEAGRRQLAQLYAGDQEVDAAEIELIVRKTEDTSAAFIKELMRRATQYAIVRGLDERIDSSDIDTAVEEMLFSGGAFNRKLLGALSEQ